MKLAHVVIPAMRRADPHATIIAPATNRIDLRFLSACFRDGLLSLVNAVSVHPYRLRSPESVVADVKKLRQLMERYSPQGATIPIVSSEWGYPTIPLLFSAKSQGEYLARELLVDLSIGIRLSIWYDWHDDGTKPFNPEDNFGTVTYHYKPKPAFREMQRLVVALGGLHFVERLPSVPQDWLLLFTGPHHSEIAAWTTGSPHTVKAAGIALHLDGNPRYLSVSAGSVGQLLHNPQGGQRRKRAP